MKPTRAEELYFDPGPDLFMLTPRELADRSLALAGASCHRAEHDADALDAPAIRTALRFARGPPRRPARTAGCGGRTGHRPGGVLPCPRRIP
ncbi:MAG: hypothetical protein JWO67_2032 [Streptosporangiaceae bacterium]|nr:hypothetical protein [Streptosporangiaceae bacterium]